MESSRRRSDEGIVRWMPALMGAIAASLAVASSLHLSGLVTGRSKPYDGTDAGIAEAVIGAVLAVAAVVMILRAEKARTVGLVANGFAIAGFGVGLSITASGGHAPDIAYHSTVLPLLLGSFVILWRSDVHGTAARLRAAASHGGG